MKDWLVYWIIEHTFRILHELWFNFNFYDTSLRNVIKRDFSEFYNISRTSFIKDYTKHITKLTVFHHAIIIPECPELYNECGYQSIGSLYIITCM